MAASSHRFADMRPKADTQILLKLSFKNKTKQKKWIAIAGELMQRQTNRK